MLAFSESAHAFFSWDPANGEYPKLVLFSIQETSQREATRQRRIWPLHRDSRRLIARH